jgi:nucleotidyltransferase substrate binding protein (TIGR01987 family)
VKTAEAALKTLCDIIGSPNVPVIQRDAAIQRFEYSFEAVWKAARAYLFEVEGIDAASPKRVLRESRNIGLLSDEQTALGLQMVDDRNLTSHTYHEGLAQRIYERLEAYTELMQRWLYSLKESS